MAPTLGLYRQMLRYSRLFKDFNVKNYAIRSVRTRFRENKDIKDSEKLEQLLIDAKTQLEVLKRQSTISQLYGSSSHKLAVEHYKE